MPVFEIAPDAQQRIRNLLHSLVEQGLERGIQVAVYHRGKCIVDAWAGTADPDGGLTIDGDTLFPVFSVTKGPTATLAHLIVERGLIDYETPVASVWPEFAVHGKAGITLRHLLNHSAGLPNVPLGLTAPDLADWERVCAALSRETPVFAPGSIAQYHAITYGWLVGEVLRRVDGRDLPTLLREEIAEPLGLDTLFCGLPESETRPVAILEEEVGTRMRPEGIEPAPIPDWARPLHAFMNLPEAHRACLPATSGIMNARAVARHYAALLPGGVDGIELLPPRRIATATAPQGLYRSDGEPSAHALGYARQTNVSLPGDPRVAFGHGGYGGSDGWADPGRHLAVGITKNRLNQHDARSDIIRILTEPA